MSNSPRRSSQKMSPRSVLMSEVREQLSMPGTKVEAVNSYLDIKQNEFDQQSVVRSITSTKSSRSYRWRSGPKGSPVGRRPFWNKAQSMKQFHDSAASTTSSQGWMANRRKSSHVRNNQIVADFFDVQSLASAPAIAQRKKPEPRRISALFDTRSVVSKKSVGGNFLSFFMRIRNVVNDEVDASTNNDIDGLSQFYGSENFSVDDEELTLGSGLHSDAGDSVYNDEPDDTSVVVRDTIRRIIKSGPPKEKKKSLIGRIIQRRKEHKAKKVSKKESRTREQEFGDKSDSHFDIAIVDGDAEVTLSSSTYSRPLEQSHRQEHISSSMSVASSPAALNSSRKVEDAPERKSLRKAASCRVIAEVDVVERPQLRKTSSCRWSGDPSLESNSSAPRPPIRRRDSVQMSSDKVEAAPRPTIQKIGGSERLLSSFQTSAPKPPQRRVSCEPSSYMEDITVDPVKRAQRAEQEKAWRENIRREMTLHSGESKDDFDSYHDDSDESVLSLLSGLLATWSAERDGGKRNHGSHRDTLSLCYSIKPMRSILKTSDACLDIRPRHSVGFDSIIIREYERTVGDNPSCSRGPPISIGWSYILAHEYPIDDYELLIKAPKRSKKEFHLSADLRTHLLMEEWDCSEEEIRKARREVTYIQYCRAKSSFSGVRSAAKEALFLRKGSSTSGSGTPNSSQNSSKSGSRRAVSRAEEHCPAPRLPRRMVSSEYPPSINSASPSSRHTAVMN